mgnify:CR=1 FL=1
MRASGRSWCGGLSVRPGEAGHHEHEDKEHDGDAEGHGPGHPLLSCLRIGDDRDGSGDHEQGENDEEPPEKSIL